MYSITDNKMILFETKDMKILAFSVEHYTIKTDITRYYLQLKSNILKLYSQQY